jgi:tetratricopeptide (TPR) repeat protein
MVDLARATTSQQLFLAILAQVLGIEMSSVARQFGTPDAKTFFSIAGGITIPMEIRDAVLSVLTSSPAVFQDRRQLNHVHLEEYLSLVASGGQPGGRLIVFHNLDKSPAEVLEFLHTIIQTLIDKDISVILEISIGGDAPLVGSAQWKIHVELFKRIAALGCFIVPSLNMEGGIELLLEQLPGLGPERARFICERVGYRPLFLYHSALWLKKRHAVAERAQGAHLIEDVEIFFEGLRPEACVSVLDRHIDLWRREIDLPYADSITAATLLNGSLPVAAVQLLVPIGIRVESVLDALTATGLFIPEPRLRGITVSHSLLLERMTATEDGSIPGYGARRFDRSRVARKLLKGIDSFTTTGGTRDLCYSALLAACEQWSEAWEHSQRAGKELLRERQLASASEAFLRGVAVAQRMIEEGYIKGARRRILSLADFLDVEDQRYRLGLRENSQRLESLEVSLRTTRFLDEEPLEEQVRLRSRYLKWRATFTRENFAEALSIARDLFSRVSDLPEIDQELAGHAVAALGITLKAVEREEESKTIFDEGLVLFPRSVYCRMQRWSNLAAFALRHNPSEALQNYRRIVDDLGDSLPIRERVHIEADIAMALFLAGFAREAAIQAAQAINLADANGIPAQGSRGRNILGCVHWLDGRIEDAANLLDRAILDAERSYMERFLWRFRVNLASVAREAGYESIALANARWAEERLVKARESQWGHLVATPSYLTSRWYVALLAIGLVYHHFRAMQDCLRLIQALSPLPAFREHLDELIEGHFPAAVFADTTHLHGGHIMITG